MKRYLLGTIVIRFDAGASYAQGSAIRRQQERANYLHHQSKYRGGNSFVVHSYRNVKGQPPGTTGDQVHDNETGRAFDQFNAQ